MDGAPPEEDQIDQAVKGCGNRQTDGGSAMRVENLKEWWRRAKREAKAGRDKEERVESLGDCWRLLARFIRHIWETGDIPRQLLTTIVVLISKGNSGDLKGTFK